MSGGLDCLSAGIIVADSVCQPIARIPPPGSLIRTDRVEFTIGGCAANVAVDMARLGLRIGISGRVGNDVFGREVRDRLLAAKVKCPGLVLSETSPTSTTFAPDATKHFAMPKPNPVPPPVIRAVSPSSRKHWASRFI